MKATQIGGLIIPKEEEGPFVNVAFTLDLDSVALLKNAGKNKSLTVRRAIRHYCQQIEPAPALVKKFNEVCIERKELLDIIEIQKKIINSHNPNVDFQAGIDLHLERSNKIRLLFSRILKRLSNLFHKNRE